MDGRGHDIPEWDELVDLIPGMFPVPRGCLRMLNGNIVSINSPSHADSHAISPSIRVPTMAPQLRAQYTRSLRLTRWRHACLDFTADRSAKVRRMVIKTSSYA